ncbi:MAG: PspA/IM30 family protein [Polyangiaceae bacterium]
MGKITPLFGGKAGESAQKEGEQALTAVIEEMTKDLISAKDEIAESRKEEKRLAKQAEIAARITGEWEQRAMSAVRAGDDVVAREALLRKRQHESEYERYRAAEKDQHQRTAAMTRALVTLNFRVEEAKHRQSAVVAQAARDGSLPELAREVADALASHDADDAMKRLAAKMTDIEAELELSDEAIANLTREASDALRSQDELTRMKRDVQTSQPPSKPLAKTQPSDETAKDAPRAALGPERTKR